MYFVFMNLSQFWAWFQTEHWAVFHLSDTAGCWSQMWWGLQQGVWPVPGMAAAGLQESGSKVVLWGSMRTLVSSVCRSCEHSSALCSIGCDQSRSWPVSVNRAQERMWSSRSYFVGLATHLWLESRISSIWEARRKTEEKVKAEVRA